MEALLVYIAAAISIVWGISHIIPTPGVVAGFGDISPDNKKIITMEWIAEGLALIFVGVVAATMTRFGEGPSTGIAVGLCAGMLLVMAALTAMTGARTSVIPIKICPIVKSFCAGLMIASLVI